MDEKMRTIVLIFTLILTFSILVSSCDKTNPDIEQKTLPKSLCFNSQCYQLEYAITEEEKTTGLMNRTNLPQNKGMLFVYDAPNKYIFWMKNTLIPLDIIWMGGNFKVNYISNAQPCEELPCELYGSENISSLYVLEINGGEAERIGLKVGNTFEMS